jgi:hypothetical protein
MTILNSSIYPCIKQRRKTNRRQKRECIELAVMAINSGLGKKCGVAELGYDRLRIRLPKNNTSKNIELMQCPECQSSYVNKNGHKKGKQNYICVNCARQFIDCY